MADFAGGKFSGAVSSSQQLEDLHIMDEFNFPECLEVRTNPKFRRRVRCYPDGSWLSGQCTGHKRSDHERMIRQHVMCI